jgi:hypothetical protein
MSEFEKRGDIVDTTDCLEAISALKSMKNGLFALIFLGLLLLQGIFWLNYFGYINKAECPCPGKPCVMVCDARGTILAPMAATDTPSTREPVNPATEPVAKAVETAAAPAAPVSDPGAKEATTAVMAQAEKAVGIAVEKPAEKTPKAVPGGSPKWSLGEYDKYLPKCEQVEWAVRVANFFVLLMTILYCLTLLVIVKISLAGRLGGLNHIVRGFFRSLLALAFLVPWQTFFPGVLLGAMYMPAELLCSSGSPETAPVVCQVLYFLRFCGLWLLVVILLFGAQCRSRRWSQATLRRLGILQ